MFVPLTLLATPRPRQPSRIKTNLPGYPAASREDFHGETNQPDWRLTPIAQRVHIRRRAVAQPAIKLSLVFELLAAQTWDDDEAGINLRQRGHVHPQFFKLGN